MPAELKSSRLIVLAWTAHFFGSDFLADRCVSVAHGPRIDLAFTTDRARLDEADAVWFHAPSIVDLPPRKRQPWVLMSMESDANYPALRNPLVQGLFDIQMTYRLDSDVPCPYPDRRQYGGFMDPAPVRAGPAGGAPVVYIASNPVSHRDAYVAEVMRHVPVDCLGTCLHNRDLDGFVRGGWGDGAWSSLMSVLPRYKFYLAFENSIATDYVTERVFHALACGVVPVYRGAGNVRDFIPASDAIIDVADFASPADLAAYLRHLDRDDAAYGRHLNWKQTGWSAQFEDLLQLGDSDPFERLAIKLAHGCGHACHCGGRRRDRGVLP